MQGRRKIQRGTMANKSFGGGKRHRRKGARPAVRAGRGAHDILSYFISLSLCFSL